MNQKEPITEHGKNNLEKELNHLIRVEREDIKKKIQEARELGDLKENAEYHAAKEKQSLIEGKIGYLQSVLSNAEVIDVTKIKSEKIVFGATVTIVDVDDESSYTYQVVGKDEADNRNGKISYQSPLGKALIGKEEGDSVIVNAPKGELEYEVTAIKYI